MNDLPITSIDPTFDILQPLNSAWKWLKKYLKKRELKCLLKERGCNLGYWKELLDYLSEENWEQANLKTRSILLHLSRNVSNSRDFLCQPKIEFLLKNHLSTLQIIDALWLIASNGHFGYSIQKKFFFTLDEKTDKETEYHLTDILGWTTLRKKKDITEFTYSLSATKGHLPVFPMGSIMTPEGFSINTFAVPMWSLIGRPIFLLFLSKLDLKINEPILKKYSS